jgi:O-antigen/teichoic acid export membrane protein
MAIDFGFPMAGSFTRVAALKSAAIMTLSTYVTIALGLVVSAVLARSLGPHDYGRYAYLLWLVGLLIAFGNHGIPITATRLLSESIGAQNSQATHAVHRWLQRAQWLSAGLVALLFIAAFPLFKPAGWEGQAVLVSTICLLCFIPKSVFQFDISVAKGHGAFWVEAVGNMLISVTYTIGVVVLALTHASLEANLWWFAGVSLTHLLIITPLLRRARIRTEKASLTPEWQGKVRHHLVWTSMQVFLYAMSNRTFETYLLSRLMGPAEVGFLAIATNLTRGGIELLSSSLSTLLMPSLAHAKGAGGFGQVRRLLTDATRYFLFLGLFLAGVGALWAAPGIHLMYGAQYQAVVPVLQAMLLVSGLLLLDNPLSSLLLIIDDQRVRTVRSVAYFVMSALMALAFVPSFGLMGAVMANAITGFASFLVFGVYVSRQIDFTPPWRDMRRIAVGAILAGIFAGGLLWLNGHLLTQWLSGLLYALVLTVASGKLGVWKRHDVALMINIAERKPALLGRFLPALRQWQTQAEV